MYEISTISIVAEDLGTIDWNRTIEKVRTVDPEIAGIYHSIKDMALKPYKNYSDGSFNAKDPNVIPLFEAVS